MKINISLTIDSEALHKSYLIDGISHSLSTFFSDYNYGDSLVEILISCKCVKIEKGFEHLFKTFKPKFIEHKVLTNEHTGLPVHLDKIFMFDIDFSKSEYDDFIESSDSESREIYIKKLIASLENLESLPKKVKDFQKDRFKADFIQFLES